MPELDLRLQHFAQIAERAGGLILEYIFGLAPPLLGILIAILTISSTWSSFTPLLPLSSYANRVAESGHYTDIDAIFIPMSILYLITIAVVLYDAHRNQHSVNPLMFAGFIFVPMLFLAYASVIGCVTYTSAWLASTQPTIHLVVNFQNAERAINYTVICICAVEFYFAVHRFQGHETKRRATLIGPRVRRAKA